MSRWRSVTLASLVALSVSSLVPVATAQEAPCRTLAGAVVVNLDDSRSPAAVAHVRRAVGSGQPWLLHIDRLHEDMHRRASLRGKPTRPGSDRDEYPPAVSAEGGAGADVELIPLADNRSAGGKMGSILRGYCDGQAFVFAP